jgi:hypothetical protein
MQRLDAGLAYALDALNQSPVVYRGKVGRQIPRNPRLAGHSSGDTCDPRDPRSVIPGEFPPVFGQPIVDPSNLFEDVGAVEKGYVWEGGKSTSAHERLINEMAERYKRTGIRPEFVPLHKHKFGFWIRKAGALYVDSTINEKVVGPRKAPLGVADVTYASISRSCPSTCKLRDAGCYAQSGKVSMTVTRLDREARAFDMDGNDVARAEAFNIVNSHLDAQGRPKIIEDRRVIRLHVSGDASTDEAARTLSRAVAEWYQRSPSALAKKGFLDAPNAPRRCWSYTHAWDTVSRASWASVSVLGSVDAMSETGHAHQRGYAPALVVASFEGNSKPILDPVSGIRYLKCPAQTKENQACVRCMLCFRADWLHKNGLGIAFEAHGAGAGKVKRRLTMVEKPTRKRAAK